MGIRIKEREDKDKSWGRNRVGKLPKVNPFEKNRKGDPATLENSMNCTS